jgi:hypothetical protein
LNRRLVGSNVAHIQISAARASVIVAQTTELVRQELISIVEHNREIEAYTNMIKESINRQQVIHYDIYELQQKIKNSQKAHNQVREDNNKINDNKLNNLPAIDND